MLTPNLLRRLALSVSYAFSLQQRLLRVRTFRTAVRGMLVSITLSNRKWYVGYITEAMSLEPKETHFTLLPIISGFRDKDTLKTQRVIYYPKVYKGNVDVSLFVLTIPMKDVVEARHFDEAVYRDNFGPQPPPIVAA